MNLYLFDCFGVLCNEVAAPFFENHFSKDEAVAIKDRYFNPADHGDYTLDDALTMVANDYHLSKEEIAIEFVSRFEPHTDVLNFILELRKNNKTALLSNATDGSFGDYFKIDFDKYFDEKVMSYKIHLIKPDIAIYKYALNLFKDYQFDHIYFIDDNPRNLVGLDKIGIEGVLYKNIDDLKSKLGF